MAAIAERSENPLLTLEIISGLDESIKPLLEEVLHPAFFQIKSSAEAFAKIQKIRDLIDLRVDPKLYINEEGKTLLDRAFESGNILTVPLIRLGMTDFTLDITQKIHGQSLWDLLLKPPVNLEGLLAIINLFIQKNLVLPEEIIKFLGSLSDEYKVKMLSEGFSSFREQFVEAQFSEWKLIKEVLLGELEQCRAQLPAAAQGCFKEFSAEFKRLGDRGKLSPQAIKQVQNPHSGKLVPQIAVDFQALTTLCEGIFDAAIRPFETYLRNSQSSEIVINMLISLKEKFSISDSPLIKAKINQYLDKYNLAEKGMLQNIINSFNEIQTKLFRSFVKKVPKHMRELYRDIYSFCKTADERVTFSEASVRNYQTTCFKEFDDGVAQIRKCIDNLKREYPEQEAFIENALVTKTNQWRLLFRLAWDQYPNHLELRFTSLFKQKILTRKYLENLPGFIKMLLITLKTDHSKKDMLAELVSKSSENTEFESVVKNDKKVAKENEAKIRVARAEAQRLQQEMAKNSMEHQLELKQNHDRRESLKEILLQSVELMNDKRFDLLIKILTPGDHDMPESDFLSVFKTKYKCLLPFKVNNTSDGYQILFNGKVVTAFDRVHNDKSLHERNFNEVRKIFIEELRLSIEDLEAVRKPKSVIAAGAGAGAGAGYGS